MDLQGAHVLSLGHKVQYHHYLLANSKVVFSEYSEDVEIEEDLRHNLILSEYDKLVAICVQLVNDPERRRQYEEQGFTTMAARDDCAILQKALKASKEMCL